MKRGAWASGGARLDPMARSTASRILGPVLLALGAFSLARGPSVARGGDEARPPALAVGAQECARCHFALHEAWQASTHALTIVAATPEALPAEIRDGALVEHGAGRTRFVREGEALAALTVGPDGVETRYPVTHQVGRTRMHMFLTRLPDGRQQVLPGMREHGAPVWFDYTELYFAGPAGDPGIAPAVAPGDPSFWTGPVRSWDAQCSRCHLSGRQALPPTPGGPRVSHRALGLDCEACHGGQAAHADAQDRADAEGDPVLRWRRLSRREQVDGCLVCHMEAEEVVPGWAPGSGRDLLEVLDPTLLDDPDRVDPAGRPLELVYAGVSFWSSACAERGGLTCTTCHDPHGGPHPSAMRGEPRSDRQCAPCHDPILSDLRAHTHHDPAGSGSRCVSCHMPRLTVERGHGDVTDHTISVPRPSLRSDRVAADACVSCHAGLRGAPPGAPPLSEATLRRSHAAWWPKAQALLAGREALAGARAGAYDAVPRLLALLGDPGAPRLARATAPVLLARRGDGARGLLVPFASDPDSLVRRRVADALPTVAGPDAWEALSRLVRDPVPAVRARAARAALLAPARLLADAPFRARVREQLTAEARWAPDDDLRWERLAWILDLEGDAAGAKAARERQALLDPGAAARRR